MAPPAPPEVPEAELEAQGWTRSADRSETVFEGLGVTVESRTLVYEDAELRRAVVEAGGPDRIWRFLFVSRLGITPSLAFGAKAAVRPQVLREAKQSFAEELHDRGIERIGTGETERVELAGDRHARLTPYRGTITAETNGSGNGDEGGNGSRDGEGDGNGNGNGSRDGTRNGNGSGDEDQGGSKNSGAGAETEVGIVGRLALWYDDGFFVAGCAGPSGAIDGWADPEGGGEELSALIRTVT
ncbi:hypothetical protein [Natronomonas sp.]|uniref:hypothetical protein n=1 Tax=Natronomonas sp. TaxID=2184060 RepID=UPI002601E525|nr:hypothetical protein [Natronomonas sp.]